MTNGLEDDDLWYDFGDLEDILSVSGEMQQTLPLDSGKVNSIHVDSSFRNSAETSTNGYFMCGTEDTKLSGSSCDQVSSQGEPVESSEEETGYFGLKLSKTTSLFGLLERQLNRQSNTDPGPSSSSRQEETKEPATGKDEMKASNFPALHLRIGNWQIQSRHKCDLVAKCYFKKRRLVWEILDGALKSKIEFRWKHIIGIKKSMVEDDCRVLEIELNEKPLFFKEINPQPRKHTIWQQVDDFTGGEALRYRVHYIKFAPEILDEHYEKLMQYDQRLSALSQMPFPSLNSPYFSDVFRSPQFSLDFNERNYQSHICPMIQSSHNQCVQPYVPSPPLQTMRPHKRFKNSIPTMPAVSNVVRDGDYVQNARPIAPAVVPNGMKFTNYSTLGMPDQDYITMLQGQGMPDQDYITMLEGQGMPDQDYITILQGQATGLSTPTTTTLLDIQNHLLGDMQSLDEQMGLLRGTNPSPSYSSSINPIQRVGVGTHIISRR